MRTVCIQYLVKIFLKNEGKILFSEQQKRREFVTVRSCLNRNIVLGLKGYDTSLSVRKHTTTRKGNTGMVFHMA